MSTSYDYIFYTDGGCDNVQSKVGGWAFARADSDHLVNVDFVAFGTGYDPDTTSNIMEMSAVIEALKTTQPNSSVLIHSDSEYVIKGISEWIIGWKKNGWRTAGKKPVKNKELWIAMDALCSERKVFFKKVKGHSGILGNELADTLIIRAVKDKGTLDTATCTEILQRLKKD